MGGGGGERERERFVVSMEANGVATLSVQWRLASGLIIVGMSVSFDVMSIRSSIPMNF